MEIGKPILEFQWLAFKWRILFEAAEDLVDMVYMKFVDPVYLITFCY